MMLPSFRNNVHCALPISVLLFGMTVGCQYDQNHSHSSLSGFSPFSGQTRVPPPATGSYIAPSGSAVPTRPAGFTSGSNRMNPNQRNELPRPSSTSGDESNGGGGSGEIWPESFGPRSQSNHSSMPASPIAKTLNSTIQNPVARVNTPTSNSMVAATEASIANQNLRQGLPVTDLTQASYGNPVDPIANHGNPADAGYATPIASQWDTAETKNANFDSPEYPAPPQVVTTSQNSGMAIEPRIPSGAAGQNPKSGQSMSPLSWRNPNAQ